MFVNTNVYFGRITDALEKVVAPEIESDEVRGQVFAVISLIQQVSGMIEYKHDLIEQEIKEGSDIVKNILRAVEGAGIEAPEEIGEFLEKLDEGKAGGGLTLRNKVDEMLCMAIDCLRDNRGGIEAYKEVDKMVRDYIYKIAGRDLGFMKPPMIEKISRPRG